MAHHQNMKIQLIKHILSFKTKHGIPWICMHTSKKFNGAESIGTT